MNMCPYKKCTYNCSSIQHHRYIYATVINRNKEKTKAELDEEKPERSSKVNWKAYYELFGRKPEQSV